jgi:hypothetical protein
MRRSEELSTSPSGRAFASACVLEFERLYEQASLDWNHALSLDPNHSASLMHLFAYYLSEQNHTEAAQLLRLRPENDNADLELLFSKSKSLR